MHPGLKRFVTLLLTFAVLAGLGACGGRTGDPGLDTDAQSNAQDLSRRSAYSRSELDARWNAVLADPGKPGVDFSTRRLTVSYKPGLVISKGLPKALPPAGDRAADQGNAVLRVNRQYEALTDAIAGSYGLRITNQIYKGRTQAAGFELPAGADGQAVIDQIRRDFADSIEWVTFARLAHPCYDPNDPGWTASSDVSGVVWGIRRIGCQSAWDFTQGDESILLGVMDSGCNIQHEELVNTVIDPSVTFPEVNCDVVNQESSMEDLQSHGTGCVGIVAAEADNNLTIVGGAPHCKVLPLKITNDWVDGTDMNVAEAGYLGAQLGLRAISMSFGYFQPVPVIEDMCIDVDQDGVLLLASAGNEDADFERWPAAYPQCMSVGATNTADGRISHEGWWGSNFGPGVDIAAPGEDYASCSIGATDAYQSFGGTSGAAPHVLAVAGLLFSYFPTWSNNQARQALRETGVPTTGFGFDVPRVDAANLFDTYGISLILHPPKRLLEHGVFEVSPEVNGAFDSIGSKLNDVPSQSLNSLPWTFNLDTASLGFEQFNLKLSGISGGEAYSAEQDYWVDNSAPVFPFKEGFEDLPRMRVISPLDHDVSLISQLYLTTPTALQNLIDNGPGTWQSSTAAAHSGVNGYYCGLPAGDDYGSFELDCLVSQAIDLSPTSQPTLSFYHHYNVEDGGSDFDKVSVLISSDYGLSWQLGQLKDGAGLASFSGLQSDWSRVDIDLSSFAGQTVHIAFVFNSDELASGEDSGQPKGWWIDDINVSKNYSDQLGAFSAVSSSEKVVGLVPQVLGLTASVSGAADVGRVVYTLDALPYGNNGPEDVQVETIVAPFSAQLNFSGTGFENQIAMLTAHSFDTEGSEGMSLSTQVYIFNKPGDVNADTFVDQSDRDAFDGKVGLSSSEAGYIPWFDSDFSGVITESDAAAVGYFWSPAI